MDGTETKKRYLKRYKRTMARIELLKDKLAETEERTIAIRSPRITGMPGGGQPYTAADLVAEKAELELRIMRLQEKADKAREEILNCIDELEDPHAAEVLEMFFIGGLGFMEISERMAYSDRHIMRLYSEGLEKIQLPPMS